MPPLAVRVPFVANKDAALTSRLFTVPKPTTVLLFVTFPPARTPPATITVPALAQAGLIVNVSPLALSVPVFTGAAVNVALLLRLKLPELTRLLLIAPWKKNAPLFVTTPLRNVSAVNATVALLVKPSKTDAP